jgi:hypothetical protein
MTKVRSTLLFDLSPNESTHHAGAEPVYLDPRGWDVPNADIIGPAPTTARPPGWPSTRVAFAEDQLGNAYRFVPFRVDADMWRPSDTRPAWLDWYEARRKDLERI